MPDTPASSQHDTGRPAAAPSAQLFPPLTPASEDRREHRREDDAEEYVARDTRDTRNWFERHWAKIAWGLTLLVTVTGFVSGKLGVKVTGADDAQSALARTDTAIIARVLSLEAGQATMTKRLDGFDRALLLQNYLLCIQAHRGDPVAAEKCQPIIERMRNTDGQGSAP